MKRKQFKIVTLLVFCAGIISAQKTNKKFSEQFYTNKDVAIEINASNAEIDVQTWNKNEVAVEAVIEVEGISKKEAQEYLDKWKFEALGNKSKVKINANANNFHSFGRNNFINFNSDDFNFPVVIPEISEIELPEIPELAELPEMPFIDNDIIIFSDDNLENTFKGLEEIEFDFDKYAKDGDKYFFQWKDDTHDIKINSKKEWEKFKKTKEYKKLKKQMKESQEKLKKSLKESREAFKNRMKISEEKRVLSRKKMKEAYAKARKTYKDIDRAEIKRALADAQKSINSSYSYVFSSDKDNVTINGKKVKITKKITIKVPKKATFDLNTRHCKVKLPGSKVSGNVSYGSFNANTLTGGDLNISYSPVLIEQLSACTLFLNNVTDAKIASVTNSTLNANSSDLVINTVNQNVDVTHKFGELTIDNIAKNFDTFKLLLNYTDAKINLANVKNKLSFDIGNKSPFYPNKSAMKFSPSDSEKEINGNFTILSDDKKVDIKGKYSQLVIKQ